MKIELKRLDEDYNLEARNESGRKVQSDGAPDIGGHGLGMRPMEMLISSLGSCSAIDVIFFLRKMRQPLEDIRLEIEAEREKDKKPSLFTDIRLHYHLSGDLNETKVAKAIKLSVEQYCSVARILEKTATLHWSFTLHPAGQPA